MKKLSILLVALVLTACGSSKKKPRDFELEYKVVNASDRVEPDWLNDASKYDGKSNFRYFSSESEHAVKRLCVKSATARAIATVASEVEHEVRNEYTEVTREDEERNIEKFFSETLKQIVQAELAGVRVINQYWEKRKFLPNKDGGQKVTYACYTLVGISDKDLEEAKKISKTRFKAKISKTFNN
jgi:hypothetical protein